MMAWLSPPSDACSIEERVLSRIILETISEYVEEMENHCMVPEGGVPRWKSAGKVVSENIVSSLRADSKQVTASAFKSKLMEYQNTLHDESISLEEEIRSILSKLVISHISRYPESPSKTFVAAQMDDLLRTKILRLVELPLWIQAVTILIDKNHVPS
eukprot:TRINITY_DN37783_c0_g1_i1.p1 TRINITY_DN37783_c0_g1~~TRINITY_DN37783_c0_g1_i1.p1  ORF type:complete len:180 (+),score=34.65 TRINITY_DN37783_c0_g1_i1:69-542(+)